MLKAHTENLAKEDYGEHLGTRICGSLDLAVRHPWNDTYREWISIREKVLCSSVRHHGTQKTEEHGLSPADEQTNETV